MFRSVKLRFSLQTGQTKDFFFNFRRKIYYCTYVVLNWRLCSLQTIRERFNCPFLNLLRGECFKTFHTVVNKK